MTGYKRHHKQAIEFTGSVNQDLVPLRSPSDQGRSWVKTFLPLIPLTLILALTACGNGTEKRADAVRALLDSMQSEYAPDTRVALWTMEVRREGKEIILSGEVDNREAYNSLVKVVDERFPGMENRLVLLPVEGTGQAVNGLVNNSVAHLRSAPRHMADIVSQTLLGTPVRILKETEGWYLIQTPDRYLGWVDEAAVVRLEGEGFDTLKPMPKVVFFEPYGFSYSEPDNNSLHVSDLVMGCILPECSEKDGYVEVEYPDGRKGWVEMEQVIRLSDLAGRTPQKDSLVKTALRFNGVPYLWGGTSAKAFDCSGFSSTIYYLNGTILQRDAGQQARYGREITTQWDYSVLEPGDLLFFGRRKSDTEEERVTHVAMYIGDTEFIHSSGRVKISSMDSTRTNFIPEYPELFVRATRIAGEEGSEGAVPLAMHPFYRSILNEH